MNVYQIDLSTFNKRFIPLESQVLGNSYHSCDVTSMCFTPNPANTVSIIRIAICYSSEFLIIYTTVIAQLQYRLQLNKILGKSFSYNFSIIKY